MINMARSGGGTGGPGFIVSNDKFMDEIVEDCDVGTKTLGAWLSGGGKITFSFIPGDDHLEFAGNASHPVVAQINEVNAMEGKVRLVQGSMPGAIS